MRNQTGVTLVEVVVAAMLMTILGSIMISVLGVSNQQVNSSFRNMKLCMQYETAVDQIARMTRAANCVTVPGDSFPVNASSVATGTTVYMRSPTGDTIGGYQIDENDRLNEFDTATGSWKLLKINPADSGIKVTTGSNFTLSMDRSTITLNVNVSVTHKNRTEYFSSKGESFICRNRMLR